MSLITITENIGCGGMEIANIAADALKLELYDDRKLEEKATEMGLRGEDLKAIEEKVPGFFSLLLSYKPEAYLDLLQTVVYEVAREGQGIIFGHGSQILLRDFGCAMHVRIHASDSNRISYLIDQKGLSRDSAQKMIHKSDSERRGFLRFAFHIDWNDPSQYDLIINRDKLTIDLAAKIIIEAARSDEIKECSLTALESMEKLSLTRKIEAAILKDNLARDSIHIEVPERGVAHITGFTYTREYKDRLLKVVKNVPGVQDVQSSVVVLPAGLG